MTQCHLFHRNRVKKKLDHYCT